MKMSCTLTFDAPDFDTAQQVMTAVVAEMKAHGIKATQGQLIDTVASKSDAVRVYTDGGCDIKKNGLGAWAHVIEHPDGQIDRDFAPMLQTTNNRMEMMALIRALEKIEIGLPIIVTTDSEYLIKGVTQWSRNWVRNGWRTRENKEVMNRDLWERLLALFQVHEVTFEHVRGHTGHPQNEICDTLCTQAMMAAHKAILSNSLEFPIDIDQQVAA